ncbi:MAG: bifunctional transaldolase/phosoglucose isomerase, partial [Bacteroidota bacterium]|nr:bifunctional transaldolase/phosoglucose isomerase [Bacteroidota bacterium]
MNTPLNKLINFGQSVWLDNISRTLISSGELKSLVAEDGVRGITSNPTIFQKALSKGESYDSQIIKVVSEDPLFEILDVYELLAVKDIRDAADILLPVYKESNGNDGYVSIEVSPLLAYQTEETIREARKLFAMVGRPNVMIKIPATKEGMPAVTQMISEGVNVNVTLIFSPTTYLDVVEAYISGLEKRAAEGKDISNIASVASFFISRIDTAVDNLLNEKNNTTLKGKIAIANAKLVYQKAKELFSSDRFKALEAKGAKMQRLLWASTSTKNPEYPDTIYVEELIGKNTVNTMPPDTVTAYKDHGNPMDRIETGIAEAEKCMADLKAMGIDFEEVTEQLTTKGVELFMDSFDALLAALQNKLDKLRDQFSNTNNLNLKPRLTLRNFRKRYNSFFNARFNERLFEKDFTLWKKDPAENVELSNRLGWLTLPLDMINDAKEISIFAEEVKSLFEHVVVLGMGGSSLAPEVFFKVFKNKPGYPALKVLDSTHPLAVKEIEDTCNLQKTLFIVASKSGGTIETMSFFSYFYNKLGSNAEAGKNFIAITDPGTSLEKLAKEKQFRKIFSSPAEVGGRFSALTHFGLVPAALIGIDIMELLNRAESQMYESKFFFNAYGYILGMVLGEKAVSGADKLTFITSPSLAPFPVWIEQLVAESTGKEGKGILPLFDPYKYDDLYLEDRVIVYIALKNEKDDETIKFLNSLADYHTVIYIYLDDLYDLGKEFYRWEIITAAAGSIMEINP